MSARPAIACRCLACCTLAIAFLSLSAAAAQARARSAYFRIAVGPEHIIYGLLWEDELFLAEIPEKLTSGPPVKAVTVHRPEPESREEGATYIFPDIPLPAPPEALPAGFSQLRVRLVHSTGAFWDPRGVREEFSFLSVQMGALREDADGALWRCSWYAHCQTGKDPRDAPAVEVRDLGPLSLKLSAKLLEERKAGVGAVLLCGETELYDLTKDGEKVLLRVRLLDRDGDQVMSEEGDLDKFGFT